MRALVLLTALVCPVIGWAQSATQTCVEVITEREDKAALRRMVMDEIDRHSTHRAAAKDCLSHLRVEVVELKEGQYLTGRINAQVPHRERVQGDDIAGAIEELLTVLLHNDPVRLRGPKKRGWLRQGLHTLKRGRTLFGVEMYETVAWLDGAPHGVAGFALTGRREVAAWHLGVRLGAAFSSEPPDDGHIHLTGQVTTQLQLLWFSNSTDDVAFYVGPVAGLDHQRFRGPQIVDAERSPGNFSKTGFSAGGRAGVELLRTTTSRIDIFTQVTLPAFVATDEQNGVVDAWVPTATVGIGLVF